MSRMYVQRKTIRMLRSPHNFDQPAKSLRCARRTAGLAGTSSHRPLIRPGVTTAEIDAVIALFLPSTKRSRCFEFSQVHAGLAALSRGHLHLDQRGGRPRHPRPAEKLVEGDIVSIDTGCKLNGWCGDAAATYPVGRIDPEVRRLLDVTRGVLDPGHRADGQVLALERGGRRRWRPT